MVQIEKYRFVVNNIVLTLGEKFNSRGKEEFAQ